MPPILRVEGLTFRYPTRRRPALQGVSFAVEPGETLLVLGPSGSGKSTLALALNGLIPQAIAGDFAGRVTVAGLETRTAPLSRLTQRVGLVFQDPEAQFCLLTVADEVAFGLENLAVPPAEMDARIDRALQQVGLLAYRQARLDRLSGGQKQRLALACVLAMEPEILVFDEPTAHLDPAGALALFADLARLKATGRTLVIIEHRLDALMPLVDRVLVLSPTGQVLAWGEPRAVFRDHWSTLQRLGLWLPQVSALGAALAERGRPLTPFPLTVAEAEAALAPLLRARPVSPTDGPARPPASRPAGEPVITVRRLTYAYPGGAPVLSALDLTVRAGDFLAIVGANGAGKSTLARLMAGLLVPPPGTVFLGGDDLARLAPRQIARRVGYVFQNPEHQFLTATVFDEVAFGLRQLRLPRAEVERRTWALLERLGLAPLARAHPFALSQGEKRRLSVATALVLEPEVLILDEPTFGQDYGQSERLLGELQALNQQGRTVVVITHDMGIVAAYARRVAVLAGGRLLFDGPPAALFAQPDRLRQAALVPPPLVELSQRLAATGPWPPVCATIDQFLAWLEPALSERVP
jgi:energy-coupling factor transport system ATP-binding protein